MQKQIRQTRRRSEPEVYVAYAVDEDRLREVATRMKLSELSEAAEVCLEEIDVALEPEPVEG